jgi:hypothetical protein
MMRTQLDCFMSTRGMRRTYLGCCLALVTLSLSLFTNIASAGSVGTSPPQDVTVTVRGWDPTKAPEEGRSETYRIPVQNDNKFDLIRGKIPVQPTGWTLTDLAVVGNIDPFASLNFAVTNNAAITLQFSVSVTVPVAPQGPLTLHGGSFAASLVDSNAAGSATVSTATGIPLYQGQIDGATVLSIYPDPYSLTIPFGAGNVPALNPGLPGPTLPSGPATTTIGIINTFRLSPGDSLAGVSFLLVVAVPEPSTMAMVALGVMTFSTWRRRR